MSTKPTADIAADIADIPAHRGGVLHQQVTHAIKTVLDAEREIQATLKHQLNQMTMSRDYWRNAANDYRVQRDHSDRCPTAGQTTPGDAAMVAAQEIDKIIDEFRNTNALKHALATDASMSPPMGEEQIKDSLSRIKPGDFEREYMGRFDAPGPRPSSNSPYLSGRVAALEAWRINSGVILTNHALTLDRIDNVLTALDALMLGGWADEFRANVRKAIAATRPPDSESESTTPTASPQ